MYDHLYYVSCEYDNQNNTMASFVPAKNRQDNESSMCRNGSYFFWMRTCVRGGGGEEVEGKRRSQLVPSKRC